jgi:hypothetical protein
MKCLVERTQQLILGGEDENKTTSILTNGPNKLECLYYTTLERLDTNKHYSLFGPVYNVDY